MANDVAVVTNNKQNAKLLDTRINAVRKQGGEWNAMVQTLAIDIISWVQSLNGAGLEKMSALHAALNTNGNREQFKRWVTTYFPLAFIKDNGTYKLSKKAKMLTDDDWKYTEASEHPWFGALTDGEQKERELDLAKVVALLAAIGTKIDKASKGETNYTIKDSRVLDTVPLIKEFADRISKIA